MADAYRARGLDANENVSGACLKVDGALPIQPPEAGRMGYRSLAHADPGGPIAELTDPTRVGDVCPNAHARRVAALSALIAAELGECAEAVRDVYLAGALHEREGDWMAGRWADVPRVTRAAALVARMRECFDACAPEAPDTTLPRGARILAVADAFDTETEGNSAMHRQLLALARIVADAGSRYDPAIVRALLSVLDSSGHVCH